MAKRLRRQIPRAEPRVVKEPKRKALTAGETALRVLPPEVTSVPVLVDGFHVSVNGLLVDGQPTLAEAEQAGAALCVMEKAAPFALGDFVAYVEDRFGESAAQIIDAENGWSLKTVSVYRWLAKQVAPNVRRMDRLGVRHHLLVATLTPGAQRQWLNKAADSEAEPWTVARLSQALREGEDLPPSALWVLVAVESLADQETLMAMLEAQGRSVKAVTRRGRKEMK